MDLIAYGKGSSTRAPGGGIYIGKVTRINGELCYVQIPRLNQKAVYGPCPTAFGASTLAVGDTVFCAFTGHQLEQVVVLATTSPIDLTTGFVIDGGTA